MIEFLRTLLEDDDDDEIPSSKGLMGDPDLTKLGIGHHAHDENVSRMTHAGMTLVIIVHDGTLYAMDMLDVDGKHVEHMRETDDPVFERLRVAFAAFAPAIVHAARKQNIRKIMIGSTVPLCIDFATQVLKVPGVKRDGKDPCNCVLEAEDEDMDVKSFARAQETPAGAHYISVVPKSVFSGVFKHLGLKTSYVYKSRAPKKPHKSTHRKENVWTWRATAMGVGPCPDNPFDNYAYGERAKLLLTTALGANARNVRVGGWAWRNDEKNRLELCLELYAEKVEPYTESAPDWSAADILSAILENDFSGLDLFENGMADAKFTATKNKGEYDVWLNVNSSSQCAGQVKRAGKRWIISGIGMDGSVHPTRLFGRRDFVNKEAAAQFMVTQLRKVAPGPVKVRMMPTPPMPVRPPRIKESDEDDLSFKDMMGKDMRPFKLDNWDTMIHMLNLKSREVGVEIKRTTYNSTDVTVTEVATGDSVTMPLETIGDSITIENFALDFRRQYDLVRRN